MLTLIAREEISRGLAEDLLFAEIALRIGRDPSVVSRDVARHGGRAGYRAVVCRQLHGPENYTDIPPEYRLWVWPDDVARAVRELNLVPAPALGRAL